MPKLRLSLAVSDYDRTRALMEGKVQPEGIDLHPVTIDGGGTEVNFRMLRYKEFDASEMSMGSYILSLFEEDPPFIAIPVFPFRTFRHSYIFINAKSGIRSPKDLKSKRVGIPRYQQSACVWIKGILSEHYGVPITSVNYVQGGVEDPGRWEGLSLKLPRGVKLETAPRSKRLSDMLEAGEIDALYSARVPSGFTQGSKNIKRLFPDYVSEEKKYYRKTGVFPIMHTIVIRKEVYEKDRWVAQALFKAFQESKQQAYSQFYSPRGNLGTKFMLPWITTYLEEVRELLGWDFYPYGIEQNRKTLQALLRYTHEQGLAKRLLRPEQIFAEGTKEQFKV
ncbi:MAG: ABC transporter substrate-binding protein [Nitrososphaerota archaeon]|nr:ABC transporter substrate-binding protein [Nitrososphaerota archaeon]